MENFQDWQVSGGVTSYPNQVPFSNQDLDEYLGGYAEIDNLLSETLTSLQDLDIPVNQATQQNNEYLAQYNYQQHQSNANNRLVHSKKVSGTAIFGFSDHNKELSFNGGPSDIYRRQKHSVDTGKSISPNQIFSQNAPIQRPSTIVGPTEEEDFTITGKNPGSYKFPMAPVQQAPVVNNYSVEYMQEISKYFNQSNMESGNFVPIPEQYVDDFEPLLNENYISENNFNQNQFQNQNRNQNLAQNQNNLNYSFQNSLQQKIVQTQFNNQYHYVPIPVQQPSLKQNFAFPPPQAPQLEQFISPEDNYSSPEPPTPGYSEPQYERFTSEIGEANAPYTNIINSSPVRSLYQSTIFNRMDPRTPKGKGKKELELTWSPVVLQNASLGGGLDHQKIIDQFSPRRKSTEKVSTLPPGAIDTYIDGPDEEKIYTCNFQDCGKRFTRRYNIRSHIQTHLSDRPYNCQHCQKKFVRQHDLHRHEKIHQEFIHGCPCGKRFSRHDALKRHQLRNICSGGIMVEGSVMKPMKKRGRPKKVLDPTTSDRLMEDVEYLRGCKRESLDDDLYESFPDANLSFTI